MLAQIISRKNDALIIFFVAFFARILAVTLSHIVLISDSETFRVIALEILSGKGYGNYRVPGYTMFLASHFFLFGWSNIFSVQFSQCILGSLTCVLVYLITDKLACRFGALISAICACFYIPLILYCGAVMTETLSIFFLYLTLLTIILDLDGRSSCVYSALTGIFIGINILIRPIFLFFPIFISFLYLLSGFGSIKLSIKKVIILLGMVLLVLSPHVIRNAFQYSRLIVTDVNNGVTFYTGNNPKANGVYNFPNDWHDRPPFKGLDEFQRERTGYVEAFKFIKENPKQFMLLLIKKFNLFFWKFPFYLPGYDEPQWITLAAQSSCLLLLIMGSLSMVILIPRFRKFALLYMTIIYLSAFPIISLVQYRYKMIIEPVFMIFIGCLVCELKNRAIQKEKQRLGI